MLEGLEISEVLKSDLEFSSRLDAEYYKPSFLKFETLIRGKGGSNLKSVSNFLIGPFGSAFTVDNYVDIPDYRYIRGKDVKPLKLKDDDNVYMPKKDYERLSKYALTENDILVSVVGTLGNAALITQKDLPAIFSCKSTVLRTKTINPIYLLAYINCKYGRQLLLRKERGAIQKGFNLGDLETLEIFTPTNNFQKQIESVFRTSLAQTEKSKENYHQAEQLLLQEIDLEDFEPSREPVNVKSFKESFGSSGRLDAEYYQKKYEDYAKLVYSYKSNYANLNIACDLKDKNYTPGGNKQYKYVELSNIDKTGNITGCTEETGQNLPSRARRLINSNDVIISSIKGSLDSCALVTEEYNNAICSTGFYVISSTQINPETLLVLFKSELMQNILKQSCSGTILTAINKNEFLNIPVPLINNDCQLQIKELVKKSFSLKKQSEHLLEVAKRAVEMAIEENEEVALDWIGEQTSEYPFLFK